jgi:hypothetical protein
MRLAQLTRAAALLTSMLAAVETRPADLYAWLPLQHEYMSATARYRALLTGNQTVGKTTVAMHDVVLHAAGTHPTRQQWCSQAGEYWVICDSWPQSVVIQGKLWGVLPRDLVHPEDLAKYDEVNGWGVKGPSVRIRHTSGAWSMVRFKTANQRGKSLASATLAGAVFDEPPPNERIFTEVRNRCTKRGWLSVCMTPINAPVEWFRELVEKEGSPWHKFQRRLTPAEFIPVGHTQPIEVMVEGADGIEWRPADQDYIDHLEMMAPAREVDVVVHGGWSLRVTDRYYMAWDGQTGWPPAGADLWTSVGFDHGAGPGKQCGVVVQADPPGADGGWPHVYVLDEWTDATGRQTPREDAAATLAMLKRCGLSWTDLDDACGDRVHLPGSRSQKSNKDLEKWLCRSLKVRRLPRAIRTIKRGTGRGAGSAATRWKFLHYLMVHGRLTVSPRCVRVLEALDNWDGDESSPYKDILDAVFYAVDRWTFERRTEPVVEMRVAS